MQQNYLPIVFSGKIAAFCHQQWLSCAQPSSSYEQFPCRQCELGLEVLLIFQHSCLYLFWLNSANQINQGLRTIRIVKRKTKKILRSFQQQRCLLFGQLSLAVHPHHVHVVSNKAVYEKASIFGLQGTDYLSDAYFMMP